MQTGEADKPLCQKCKIRYCDYRKDTNKYRPKCRQCSRPNEVTIPYKTTRNKRIKGGLCPNCGEKPKSGQRYCEKCLLNLRSLCKNRRQRLKEEGKCSKCAINDAVTTLCNDCRKLESERHKAYNLKKKIAVLVHYGGINPCCACSGCKESDIRFLTIDHKDGNGAEHRKHYKKKYGTICNYLIKNNFPDGFRVLCWNCNCGRYFNNGVCPHLDSECENERGR